MNDLTGKRFGKLVARKRVGTDSSRNATWLCKCDCGNEKIVSSNHLKDGGTRSCGCLYKEKIKHGHARTGLKSPTHISWSQMVQRCTDSKCPNYKDYGGRGITVCNRWLPKNNGFINFLSDMGERPIGKSLDRIDNYKLKEGYSPKNCQWRTKKEQNNNKRNSRLSFPIKNTSSLWEYLNA